MKADIASDIRPIAHAGIVIGRVERSTAGWRAVCCGVDLGRVWGDSCDAAAAVLATHRRLFPAPAPMPAPAHPKARKPRAKASPAPALEGVPLIDPVRLVIDGPPRTKKNRPRIIELGARCPACKRGARSSVVPAATASEWAEAAIPQLRAAWAGRPPVASEVNCAAIVYRDARRGDLLGYLEAIADALQAAGVLLNDAQIVGWDGSRPALDRARPRVEITITPMVAR